MSSAPFSRRSQAIPALLASSVMLAPLRAAELVQLDATALGLADGSEVAVIANPGSAGPFTTVAGSVITASHPSNNDPSAYIQGIEFDGGDKMTAAVLAPTLGLSGNQVHSVRAWVWNADLSSEETIVAWGRRGGSPFGSNCGFHQGTSSSYGAVGHWGAGHDVAYGDLNGTDISATAGRWTNLAYTFDGSTSRVYIDGQLSNSKDHGELAIHGESNPLALGAENEAGSATTTPVPFTGTIARVEVLDEVLSAQQIEDAYDLESPQFDDGSSPGGPVAAADDAVTLHHGGQFRLDVAANDTGALDLASLQVTSGPASGNAVAHPDGTIFYQHSLGSPASDSLDYEISDSSGTSTATATVDITFTASPRFDSDFAKFPAEAPSTVYELVDAFPGLGFDSPHGFDTVTGEVPRLFIAEGAGRVQMIPDMRLQPATKVEVLDLTSLVKFEETERALKGIAVHPDWPDNGYIYLTYNTADDRVHVTRFTCSTSPPYTADINSRQVLIDQDSDQEIHTIAHCHFGPDGYLYVGFGDDGDQEDLGDNSQHIDRNFWSSIIRIDVDKKPGSLVPNPNPAPGPDPGGTNNDGDLVIPRVGGGTSGEAHFAIPPDNPFVGVTSFNGVALDPNQVRTEILLMGQRNPWSFSPEDHDGDGSVDELWVGDVSHGTREELSIYPFPLVDGGTYGGNGGWAWRESITEGYRSGDLLNGAEESAANFVEPYWTYPRGNGPFEGRSVIAGFLYRGDSMPGLQGKFIMGDFSSGNLWALTRGAEGPEVERLGGEKGLLAFELDPTNGDILVLDRGAGGFHTDQGVATIKRLTLGDDAREFPVNLSETGFFADLATLGPQPGGIAYDPNLRFWSDFAEKRRWFLIRNDSDTIGYSRDEPWTFPEGMVWAKHFDMPTEWESFTRMIGGAPVTDRRPVPGSPRRRLETRFLVRDAAGTYGVSYRWRNVNAGLQDEADLSGSSGESFEVDLMLDSAPTSVVWTIPSRSSCLSCHNPAAGHALSFHTRQLNGEGSIAESSGNFIGLLASAGYLAGMADDPATLPRHLRPDEDQFSLEARVRSYIDVNCSYCHRPGGGSGGVWDGRAHLPLSLTGLVNEPPAHPPLVPGDLLVDPGSIIHSLLYTRAAAANGYDRMPPLATTELDLEGLELLAEWIGSEVQEYPDYDSWRIAHFGDAFSAEGERDANPDGDPSDNELEWLTNTHPLDRLDHWSPTMMLHDGMVSFEYPGLGNRRVRAFQSTNLTDWHLWPAAGNDGIPRPSGQPQVLELPAIGDAEYFRFEVEEN